MDQEVWQGNSDDPTEGIPLTVKKFERFRCPYCYKIEASPGFGGLALKYRLNLEGKDSSSGVTVTLKSESYAPKKGGWIKQPDMNCNINQ